MPQQGNLYSAEAMLSWLAFWDSTKSKIRSIIYEDDLCRLSQLLSSSLDALLVGDLARLEKTAGRSEAEVEMSANEVAYHERKMAKMAKSIEELKSKYDHENGSSLLASKEAGAVEAFKASNAFGEAVLDQASVIYVRTICDSRHIMRESKYFLEDDVMLLDL
ncbi:hypothetical protein Pfo_021807 [Paulownia fortunei]|nr:hypothetical protein Pfo_021807 [Paulownia fortunei]